MTHAAVYVPPLVAACLGALGPAAARRLPPRHATWLLSVGSLVAATGTLAVLALLAWTLVGQQPEIAAEGQWSAGTLRAHAPASELVAASALGALAILLAVLSATAVRRAIALRAAYRTCRALGAANGELVVVDDPTVGAYAVPGRPGRIVVSRGLLAALSPNERRALLAHERAHLKGGHHWHLIAVALAAALNPLLRPLQSAAGLAVERCADEAAAEAAGSRRVAARALARSALAALATPAAPSLGATSSIVTTRVASLLADPPRPRPALARLIIALLIIATAAALVASKETEHLFELAMRAYRHGADG